MVVINAFATRKFTKYQEVVMKKRDARMKSTTEMINGIKVIKMSGMEDEFCDRIAQRRDIELDLLNKQYYPYIFTIFCGNATPVLITSTFFLVYILQGKTLSAEVAFPIISVLAILQYSILMLPYYFAYLLRALVSINRIQSFLLAPDIDASYLTRNSLPDDNFAIRVENGYFLWRKPGDLQARNSTNVMKSMTKGSSESDKTDRTISWSEDEQSSFKDSATFNDHILKNINLEIKRGEFIAIIGDVGSGKSSLIQSFIGEIIADETKYPRVVVNGKIAYVSQKASILNKTVKGNIIFNQEYDEQRYQEAVDLACLRDDLKILSKGDQTEIGEKGVNLSGGQKSRVSLTRAIYCDRDIYLLDDPLAALDVHVGTTIMQNCFSSHFKPKTRVLLTHNLDMLKYIDRVIIMRKGVIIGDGTFEEIKDHPYYLTLVEKFKKAKEEEEGGDGDEASDDVEGRLQAEQIRLGKASPSKRKSDKKKKCSKDSIEKEAEASKVENSKEEDKETDDKLMLAEDRVKESVGAAVYKSGMDFYGGWKFARFLLFVMCVWIRLSLESNFWVSEWTSNKSDKREHSELYYINIYSALSLAFPLFTLIRIWSLIAKSISSARKVHAEMIRSVLRAPLNTFFDRVPAGRILNRFSKDLNIVDTWLYETVSNFLVAIFLVLGDI